MNGRHLAGLQVEPLATGLDRLADSGPTPDPATYLGVALQLAATENA